MKVEKITIGRGKKLSVNYNSFDYHVSVSIVLGEEDEIGKAHQLALSTIKILEAKEIEKLKEAIQWVKEI